MSFTRIDLLPRFEPRRRREVRERWENDAGRDLFDRIITLIREGAGEDFLQYSFEKGDLGFLSDYWIWLGYTFSVKTLSFPRATISKT